MQHWIEGAWRACVAGCGTVGIAVLVFGVSGPLAATVTVTGVVDDINPNNGAVTFREAITAINAGNALGDPDIVAQNPGIFGVNDTIKFDIAGRGVHTINVGTGVNVSGVPLPVVTKPVLIDGYSQSGAVVNTMVKGDNALVLIELNGAGAGANANGLHLGNGSAGSVVQGLVINAFSANGIAIESDGNTIQGNFIGTDPTGTLPGPGNAGDGVLVDKADGNVIGGDAVAARNLIENNGGHGVEIIRQSTVIMGNVISCNGGRGVVPMSAAGGGNEGLSSRCAQ
jgi:hypothetical protein